MNIVLVLFYLDPNFTSGNTLTQKYRTYLPVCACAECPPGVKDESLMLKGVKVKEKQISFGIVVSFRTKLRHGISMLMRKPYDG